jgi:transcriptional regulator with XRE-family HTH domain
MPNPLRISFGRLCRDTRVLLDITQSELAAAVGVSRSHIAGVETGRVNPSLDLVGRIGDALGLDLELVGRPPTVIAPRSTDLVHARCSGYVDRRFRLAGWITRREVEVIHARSHGWIDLLAFHPLTRTLVIVEIKTRLDDLGAIERQVAWYERSVRDVVPMFGWRPRRVSSWLLLLESEEVETAVQQRGEVLRSAFGSRAAEMREVVRGVAPPGPGSRGLALIDPSSRRADWLVPTRSDGRRSHAPYRDYADAARRIAS